MLFFVGVAMLTLDGPLVPFGGSQTFLLEASRGAVSLRGIIVSDPEQRYGKQQFVMEVTGSGGSLGDRGRGGGMEHVVGMAGAERGAVGVRVLVRTALYPIFGYGDAVQVQGVLEYLFLVKEEGYARSLMKDGVAATLDSSSVTLVQQGGVSFFRVIFDLRKFLSGRIDDLFPSPDESLVLGVLLGIRTTMPQALLDAFQTVGLTHILAVSGYNITLVINVFMLLFGRLSRRFRLVLTLFGILVFTVLTGMSPSVVRAAVMGGLAFFSLNIGRKSGGVHILLISAACMVAVNPSILLWDISFQLSLLSTMGLLVLLPLWEKFFAKFPPVVAENLSVTLAATVFTTPITLYYFGRLSLISPIANVVFLPFIPALMMISFLGLAVSFVLAPLAGIFVGVTWLLVSVFVMGVGLLAAIPFASMPIEGFSLLFLVAFYALIAFYVMLSRKSRPGQSCSPDRAPDAGVLAKVWQGRRTI